MNYIEYKIEFGQNFSNENSEIAIAMLSDMGFDSFDDNNAELLCYITVDNNNEFEKEISDYIEQLRREGNIVSTKEIETVNWNKEWESNFEPIDIDDICRIRAPFHEPNNNVKHDIIIMPKMSFGTGHHATTYLMTKTIFSLPIQDKYGLDMGSGTGVLAIAALKAGASTMHAVDIDEWAYYNCIENCQTNELESNCEIIHGDVTAIEGNGYDFILANINRNILLADMDKYNASLRDNGYLVVSGFLEIDLNDIENKAVSLNFTLESTENKDGWVVAIFKKSA